MHQFTLQHAGNGIGVSSVMCVWFIVERSSHFSEFFF